jgi:methylated-DNA-protein-cysteine methyltransferase-like protein
VTSHQRIFAVVRRIPRGRVATYGQVAALAGLAGQSRLVGYALSAVDGSSRIPWHRVINAEGRISLRRADSGGGVLQRMLLEREGVRFDAGGRTDLERYRWNPRPRSSAGLTRRPTSVSRRERS